MLFIFDLDDTLIKTSESTVPIKLRDALNVMVNAGLNISSKFSEKESALSHLMNISETATCGKGTITTFCQELGQEEFAKLGINEYYNNIDLSEISVPIMAGANQILNELSRQGHHLVLLSYGVEQQQLEKSKQAGLDLNVFKQTFFTPHKNKEIFYQNIINKFGIERSQVITIGDSLARDILPAKGLGIKTVHLRSGRSKHIQYTSDTQPSFSIKSLKEVLDVVKALEK